MKLSVKIKDVGDAGISPRDVRNYVGSIVDEKFINKAMWHQRSSSPVIYPKVHRDGFEIVNYTNDIELMQHIKNRIDTHRIFYGENIDDVRFVNEQYNVPQKGDKIYMSRTPLIIGVNPFELRLLDCRTDSEYFKRYLNARINDDVRYQIKNYLNLDITFDIKITPIEIKRIGVQYKDDVRLPAVVMKFHSTHSLPRFLGYKTGLGWGEIIKAKNFI